jgi:hypothetical protein
MPCLVCLSGLEAIVFVRARRAKYTPKVLLAAGVILLYVFVGMLPLIITKEGSIIKAENVCAMRRAQRLAKIAVDPPDQSEWEADVFLLPSLWWDLLALCVSLLSFLLWLFSSPHNKTEDHHPETKRLDMKRV